MGKQGVVNQPGVTQAARRVRAVATVKKLPKNYPDKYDLLQPLPSSETDCVRMTRNASVHTTVGSVSDLHCLCAALRQFTKADINSASVAVRLETCRRLLDKVDSNDWLDFADHQGGRLWLLRHGLVKVL